MTRTVGGLLALLLVLTACGDDGPSKAQRRHDKAASAIAGGLRKASDTGDGKGPVLTGKEASCAGSAMVDRVGTDALVKQKVLEDDLSFGAIPARPSPRLAKATVRGLSSCVGLVEFAVRTLRGLVRKLAASSGQSKRLDDSDKTWAGVLRCAKRRVPEKVARRSALRSRDGSLLPRALLARLKGCTAGVIPG